MTNSRAKGANDQSPIGAKPSEEELLSMLEEIHKEIRWWAAEHPCCRGKSDALLKRAKQLISQAKEAK